MKSLIDLCFLQLLITLVCIETRGSTSLRNHRVENLREVESRRKRQQSNVSVRSVKEYVANGTRTLADGTVGVKKWTIDQNNGHLVVNNGGKASKKCRGKSCLWNETALSINTKQNVIMEEKLHRNRRTGSLFLAKALDMLDHSRPRDAWNFANRMSSNTPFKLHNFTSKLNKPNHDNNVRMKKPVKNRPGEKRQQWSKPTSGMRPRFFFNTAPAEFVEGPKKRKPSPVPQFEHGAIHISVPPGGGPPRPPHMHRMEGVFPGHNNHMHMMKNAEHFPQFPVSDPFANPPLPFHSPLHHSPLHRFDQSPYAVHINAPPRLEPPMSPDNLAQQMPQSDSPIRTEPPPAAFNMMPPPEVHNEAFPPIDAPGIHPPGDIPPMLPFTELHNMPPEMPGPPIPPLDMQGMPPPGDIQPMFPPPEVQRVPVPVPVPSPPKIEHVPYPVPVPGRPSIQQVMVPVAVPSPPKIHEVAVPVESPPKIKNVPVPVPVAVPSPPMVKHVPYPVAVPVRGPPEVQKIFYPVAVPQPSQVHHVPYPVYIRYPPEIRRVPYPVLSPPKPFPVPVPSPPRVMINRVPYPVMVSQKVPYPVPIVVQHHHIHEDEGNYEESDSPEDPNNMITNSHSIDIDDQYDHPETINTGQCIVNLCRNGGTCSAYMNAYRCHCPKGYKGKHCEEQDMCRPNPCRNFGACSEVEHDYECTCTKGFIGKNCDKPDPCVPSPCDNGATCSSDGTTYSCTCRIGWMGKNCQVESKCLPINPCQNGGTCTETLGTYKCDCTPGWRGLSCEISAPETLSESPSNTPATAPCDNCQGPDDVSLDQRNTLRHHSQSSKKWTVAKRKKENKG